MACSSATLRGLAFDCNGSKGGIKAAWIAPYDSTATVTVSDGKITAISNVAEYKKYYFRKNTATMTSTLTVDEANGVHYVTTELQLTFTKMETTKRLEVEAMTMSDMSIIVLDSNNEYWYLGKDEPVAATAGTGQTGQAKGDGNFYQITLSDESNEFPYPIDSSILSTISDYPTA